MQRIYSTLLLLTLFSFPIFAQEQIGVAAAVNRNTTDLTLEQETKLVEAGYQIIQNHTIETDEIGKAQMLLLDGTAFSVGPNSSVVLDRFIYNPETAEGSLEVTARGLLRIVGGKVTKKQPALIRTNSATVGIRGGIGIVQTEGSQVNATFLYGEEMTVTPNCVDLDSFGDQCSSDFITTITEPGFSVTVESADSEPSEPEPVTEESLEAVQDELEASEEEPAEEESSSDESSSDESSSEESSDESSAEESSSEDSSDESSADESSSEESSDDSSSDDSSSDESSSEESSSDESSADDSVASDSSSDDASSDSSSDEPTTEVAQETESDSEVTTEVVDSGEGDSTEIEVDEGLLDSSGVSDVSSDVAPDELGTADAFEIETDIDLDVDDTPAEEVSEEVAETTQETTSEVAAVDVTEETEAEVAIFAVSAASVQTTLTENTTQIEVAAFALDNPADLNYNVTVAGEGSENFVYDAGSNSLRVIGELDYERQDEYELTVTFNSETGVSEAIPVSFAITNVNEQIELAVAPVNTVSNNAINAQLVASQANISETAANGTVIATFQADDPEQSTLTYTLSGDGSELLTVTNAGEIVLNGTLDYELSSSHSIVLQVSDGVNTVSETIQINVINDNEGADISSTLSATTFAEDLAVGSAIAAVNAVDPEGSSVTYTLAGTGSDNFSIDAEGNITLANALDFESAASYELTVVADDGSFATTETITVTVTDVNEFALALSGTSPTINEGVSTGTQVATSNLTQQDSAAVTYTLSGTGSDKFAISNTGVITTAAVMDYENTSSYTLTVTATDGTNTDTETINITINDIDLAVTNTLAASGQAENISIGTSILTSSTSGAEGTVTYSITESDNKFTIDSSTGEVTLANTLDYETATSHTFTVVATDGETTVTETFTLNVSDVSEVLALTANLENTEPFAEGTNAFVASPSLNNPNNETITYTLSGIGSDDFEVSEDGRVFATSHDFDSAKSYTLTLTATAGSASVSDTFTVNIANVVEQDSALLRYSAAYNSASRTGFSASATRGPSGSTLPAYYLEQVGATSSTNIRSADGSTGNGYYVDVTIDGGTQTNWRYNFPIQSGGVARFVYGKNYLSRYGYYQSLVGTQVTTLINQNSDSSYGTTDLVSAGMIMDGYFYFMTTDDAESSINYTSATQGRDYGVIVASDSSSYYADGGTWPNSITGAGYTLQECHSVNVETCLNNAGINLSDVGIMVNVGPGEVTFGYTYSELADWIDDGGNYAAVMWEAYSGAFRDPLESQAMSLISALGWQNYSTYTQLGKDMTGVADSDATITSSILNAITNNGGTLDYSSLINKTHYFWDNGLMDNIPSVCNSLVDGNLGSIHTTGSAAFICDPGRTGSSGAVLGVADRDAYRASENSFMTDWFAGLDSPNPTTSTYNLFEDQVVLAGQIFTDTMFTNYTNNAKTVTSWAVVPVENYLPSGSMNDYFFPNFIPGNFWSYGTVGVDYCAAMNIGTTCPNSYNEDYYIYSQNVMEKDTYSYRFSTNESPRVPYGQSLWWQVLNPNGVGVGLWAQISFKDSYDGALGSTTRDDQESLLSVVISNLDYRKNDTSRYSAGDTGLGMDGYHYWSYQGPTNDTSDGLGIIYGTSTIECATSNESGCFWADHNSSGANHAPAAAMITSSDPYKSGDMTLGVSYNSNNETFETGTFNTVIIRQNIPTQGTSLNATLSDFRSSYFYDSTASSYSGFFSGILEFDVSGSGNSQLASMRSSSTLASFSFDATNDDVQVVAPMTISAAPANNYTANWTTVDTGSMTLKFGDATNDEAKSAYLSSEVFAAEIQDDGAQVDGSSGGSNNLAGVMVSYNTIDREDRTLFHSTLNSIPDTAYSTWGFWAMSSVDISPDTGTQNASVHLGTWVAGETLAPNEIPTSGSASMSGAAVMNVAYRYNETGNNYNVHKYTTTANVAGTFNWGASGYSGSLDFTHYDDNNPIVENAGFHSFTVAIVGTDHTYTGNSTDTLDNGWLGGASVAGALYGGTSPDESGGRINVNLYKSGDIGTAGANDFYMAEGIYLLD